MKEIIDYESPNMKILETKIRSVLCAVSGDPATMWWNDEQDNNNWY